METNNSQLVIYQTPHGDARIDVRVKGETIWLTQRQIAELFGTKVPASPNTLRTSSHPANFKKIWLFPKWKQPLGTVQ